jgi:hypothetical protein
LTPIDQDRQDLAKKRPVNLCAGYIGAFEPKLSSQHTFLAKSLESRSVYRGSASLDSRPTISRPPTGGEFRTLEGLAKTPEMCINIQVTNQLHEPVHLATAGGYVMSPESARSRGPASEPRLLDQLRGRLRVKHYSIRTEQAYVDWVRRFVLFHGKRHPRELGAAEVESFLTDLAVRRRVSPSTQNQAKSAIPPRDPRARRQRRQGPGDHLTSGVRDAG